MVVKTETSNERALNFYIEKGFTKVGNAVEMVGNSKVDLVVLNVEL